MGMGSGGIILSWILRDRWGMRGLDGLNRLDETWSKRSWHISNGKLSMRCAWIYFSDPGVLWNRGAVDMAVDCKCGSKAS